MNQRLLHFYNQELVHLRQSAAEFAKDYPKIAGRLALTQDGKEVCPDPYVERLLEGFAFLAARIQLKLDSEFPRFTQGLLETIFPQYLTPTPSMAIVRFDPNLQNPGLAEGYTVPRGTTLRGNLGKGDRTACQFRTGHEVKLYPLEIERASYYTRDLPELNLPDHSSVKEAKAAIFFRLKVTAGVKLKELAMDRLTFHIRGDDAFPVGVYEQIFAHGIEVMVRPGDSALRKPPFQMLGKEAISQVGFDKEESLLPPSPRTFEGYRLLREYFAFPQRFLFFSIQGFSEFLRSLEGSYLEIVILLKDRERTFEGDPRFCPGLFDLFSVPVINLFPRQGDRIQIHRGGNEFPVIVDSTRPLDFEVFEVLDVVGYGKNATFEQPFRPFFLTRDQDEGATAFYTLHRVQRDMTDRERKVGRFRSNYAGTDVFISIVDAQAAPYRSDLRELGIRVLCTNRHRPIQMPLGIGPSDFSMDLNAPILGIRCILGPSQPVSSPAEGDFSWRLISHLSLNYLSLLNSGEKQGVAGLQELLRLYANRKEHSRQIDGIFSSECHPIIRRIRTPGPITFARGLEIGLTMDEDAFEGIGVFLMGAVLEQFFAKYVSVNSFTETVIRTPRRGEIVRWPMRTGLRRVL